MLEALASAESRARTQPALPPFLDLAYGYMPLCWGATLAHYLPLLLTEVGRFLPVRLGCGTGCSDTVKGHSDTTCLCC